MAEETNCCARRMKHRSDEERPRLIHRLNRIEGQVRGIRSMIEKDAYCTDVVVQTMAAGLLISTHLANLGKTSRNQALPPFQTITPV